MWNKIAKTNKKALHLIIFKMLKAVRLETIFPTTKLSKPQCRAIGIAILYSFDCKMLNSKNIAYTVLNDKLFKLFKLLKLFKLA